MTRPRRDESDGPDERETLPAAGESVPEPTEDRRTRATDPGAPESEAGATDAFFDLESMPARRATPKPPPPSSASRPPSPTPAPSRKAPELDPFLDTPSDEDERATLPEDAATFAGAEAPPASDADVGAGRDQPTQIGDFAASGAGRRGPSDEAETILDAPTSQATGPQLAAGTARTDMSARGVPGRRGATRGPADTARDPVAGTAAGRGTHPGSFPAAPQVLAEGQLIADRYELLERLGKGGMGEVWKAKHILLQGNRAIKVIKASISRDPSFRQRFLQEGQTMMRVKHPNVVEVTDLDETRVGRELFMVMEHLQGRTMYDAIRDKASPLQADVRDAARVFRELALGIQRIHDERIVHKDLKTDNVLLVRGEDGLEHPKVIDFGLAKRMGDRDAKLDEMGGTPSPQPYQADLRTTLSGTLAYMAPEQFRAEPSSFQSDIYAFGVMAYETFSGGEYPLPRGSLAEYMEIHRKGAVPDVVSTKCKALDPKLAAIFDRCLAMKREDRPASFDEVAEELDYWLKTPERAERRRKLVLMASAALALVAVTAAVAMLLRGKAASLSSLEIAAGGSAIQPVAGVVHLRESQLGAVGLSASIKGAPDDPVLEVDGAKRPAPSELHDGRLVATADLHDLADGEHALAWRASSDAAPVTRTLDVDRVAPPISAIAVRDAIVTAEGVFTSRQSPEVMVDLGEAGDRIASVVARLTTGGSVAGGQREAASDRWVVKGTSPGDGPVELEIVVTDQAGNESRQRFAYVCDLRKPEVTIDDYFKDFGSDGSDGRPRRLGRVGLYVRKPTGSKARIRVNEAAEVEAAFGSGPPVVRRLAAAGAVDLDIPAIPADGFATKLTVRDVAGNETVREFPTEVLEDRVLIAPSSLAPTLVVKGDVAWSDAANALVVIRTYPIGDGLEIWTRALRGADGLEIADAPTRRLDWRPFRETDEGKVKVYAVPRGSFADGVHLVGVKLPGDVPARSLEITVDSHAPVVESVTVVEAASGRELPEGAWALSPDVVVKATVADLALARIDLDGTSPQGELGPGRRTYSFHKTLGHEEATTWTLALADSAGNPVERAVTVLGDFRDPEFELAAPTSATPCDNVTTTTFAGHCSESVYTLTFSGPDGWTRTANCVNQDFTEPLLLPPAERATFTVVAEDRAGRRSVPRAVVLSVRLVTTDKPPEVSWTHGVTTPMEKVEPGDVVIGGRVHAVPRVFLDKTEVTNRQYREFLAATKGGHGAWCHADEPKGHDHTPSAETWTNASWNADDLPVVNVSYWDAYAFANWSGRRLPTEAEWVKAAAKSKGEAELRKWPPFAAGEWKDGVLATSESVKSPVSALNGADVSPVNCLHMGGNVSEWVEMPPSAEGGPTSGTRGGSWHYSKLAADVRDTPAKPWADRSFRANTIGFRCAVDESRVQP